MGDRSRVGKRPISDMRSRDLVAPKRPVACALKPPKLSTPRLHLIRRHGVLAPSARLRALVVSQDPEPPAQADPAAECEASCAHHRPARLNWARLLKRVFEIDLEHCPKCGGKQKIVAAIVEVVPDSNGPEDCLCLDHARASVSWRPVIEKILTHMGLQARAPPRAPARRSQLQAA